MRNTTGSTKLPVNVVGSSIFGRYPKVDAQKTYNMFISDGWMVNFPGYRRVFEFLPSGEGRGLFRSFRANIMIAIVNSNVYRVGPGLAAQLIGSLNTSSGEVSIDENLSGQICIVDGLSTYIYNHTLPANLTVQATVANLIPNYVSYHNSFFLIGNGSAVSTSNDWYVYEFATNTTISVLTKGGVIPFQVKPDYALATIPIPSQSNNVIAFGGSACELRSQVGGTENYRRNQSVNIDSGILSVSTIAYSERMVMWLGINKTNQPAIMLFAGQLAERVSTDGIDFELSRLKHPELSTAMFVRIDGHLQYVLTFYHQEDNLTIMFDTNTAQFFHLSDGDSNYHPMRQVVYFDKKTYFISLNNGSLYELNSEFTDINENIDAELGPEDPRLIDEIPRIRICKTLRMPGTAPFRANSFTFALDMGNDNIPAVQDCIIIMITEDNVPIITEDLIQIVPEGAGAENCRSTEYQGRIDLAVSGNGGETYSNYVSRPLNPRGQRRNIIRWESMGMYNEWTPKLRFWTRGRVVAGSDETAEVEIF